MTLDFILDSIELGVIITTSGGAITFINKPAAELMAPRLRALGSLSTSAHLGRLIANYIELPDEFTSLVPQETLRFSTHLVDVDDPHFAELDVVATAHENVLVFTLRDITTEHLAQTETRRIERLAAIGTMVAGFAHEVRNPVASLRAIAEALDEELHDRGLELPHTARMLKVVSRIERLVTTSLEFGRPARPRPSPTSVSSLIRNALAALSPRFTGNPISVDISDNVPEIFVDEGQLVQVLVNLLHNALEANNGVSKVSVRAMVDESPVSARKDRDARRVSETPGPPRVRIEVIDDGQGVSPDAVDHVFEAFFTTKAQGTGLGLAIAQQMVTENGARIELTSPASPTVFAIICPVACVSIPPLRMM